LAVFDWRRRRLDFSAIHAIAALPSFAEPRKQRVTSWMRGNCSDYDGPTELAQAAFIALWPSASINPLDCETHWIWDLAADCFE